MEEKWAATAVNEWMTRPEVAAFYRTPTRTLAQWALRGYGPSYVIVGRKSLYLRSDVERWIKERQKERV